MPLHIVAKDGSGHVLGVSPLYLKRFSFLRTSFWLGYYSHQSLSSHVLCHSHSYGEFVFDHSWADAYRSFGERYYPKLQSCVPFTPVTGPRILTRDTPFRDQVFDALVSAMTQLAAKVC